MADGSVTCRACGKPTPDENLRCVFCGELLEARSGLLGRLRYGSVGRWLFLAAGVVVLAFFLRHIF